MKYRIKLDEFGNTSLPFSKKQRDDEPVVVQVNSTGG
jgi:hypothetical protein